jgi:hypothetical protein
MVLGHGASEQVIGTNCPQLSATAPITQPLSCFLASDERTYPCLVAEGGPKGKQNSNGQRPRSCASKSNGRASPFYSDKGRGCGSGASCPIHPCPSRPQQERAGATCPAAAAALTYFKERGKEAYRMIGANRSSDRGWRVVPHLCTFPTWVLSSESSSFAFPARLNRPRHSQVEEGPSGTSHRVKRDAAASAKGKALRHILQANRFEIR